MCRREPKRHKERSMLNVVLPILIFAVLALALLGAVRRVRL